jgi:hypothetical protein
MRGVKCRSLQPGDPGQNCDNGRCVDGYVCDQTNKCKISGSPTPPAPAPTASTSLVDWVKAHSLLVGGIAAVAVVLLIVLLMFV